MVVCTCSGINQGNTALKWDDLDSDRSMALCSVLAFALSILVSCTSVYSQYRPSRSCNRRRARKEALEKRGPGLL